MIERTRHTTLFAMYQLTVLVGIIMMPLALALRKAGLTLPLHRIVERLDSAWDGY